jgi:ATP-dependent Lon protease
VKKRFFDLEKKIQSDVHDEMRKSQREFYLRQQLKAVKNELGETDKPQSEAEDYRQRIEN